MVIRQSGMLAAQVETRDGNIMQVAVYVEQTRSTFSSDRNLDDGLWDSISSVYRYSVIRPLDCKRLVHDHVFFICASRDLDDVTCGCSVDSSLDGAVVGFFWFQWEGARSKSHLWDELAFFDD